MGTIQYHGIPLDLPTTPVSMSHSESLDQLTGRSGTQNMDWMLALGTLPWGKLKNTCATEFDIASRISSLANMVYQVCNGGVDQYFFNGYHLPRAPQSEHDVAQYGYQGQQQALKDLAAFARDVFPDRDEDNVNLAMAAAAFSSLTYEQNVLVSHTVACSEDEYIWDEESCSLVPNPDWFEPYEDAHVEDVVYGGEYFEGLFDDASDYMEELLELRAQQLCKTLGKRIDEYTMHDLAVASTLRESLPPDAFPTSWITIYKDALGFPDDLDNLTEICVPTDWLRKQLYPDHTSLSDWFDDYTADNTDDIARKALTDGVILDCIDAEIRGSLLKKQPALSAQITDADQRRRAQPSIKEQTHPFNPREGR